MSASHRFLFSTFLFLALCCFAVSSAFAARHYYYLNNAYNTTPAKYLLTPPNCSNYLPTSTSYLYSVQSCEKSTDYNSLVTLIFKITISGNATYSDTGSKTVGRTLYKDCLDGEVLRLDEATGSATCVPDPCAALEGVEEEALVTCGVASCPSPESFEYDGSTDLPL